MIDYNEKLDELFNTDNNLFQSGDLVRVKTLCDTEGNELEDLDNRYNDLFKEGKIDFVFGGDYDGGYVYGVEGANYCFNKFELELVEED